MRRRRSVPLRGRKPSTPKRSVGRPLTTNAPITDEGPGTVVTVSPAAASWPANHAPGSEMPGVPASLTTATVPPAPTHEATRSSRSASLCPCKDSSRLPARDPARRQERTGAPRVLTADQIGLRQHGLRPGREVSQVPDRRRHEDELATPLRAHRRPPRAHRPLTRLRAPRAGRRHGRPSARATRLRLGRRCGPRGPRAPRARASSCVTRSTVRSPERNATSIGNPTPSVCTVRTPPRWSAPSNPDRPRRPRRRSAAESHISNAQTTSPSRSSQPDRTDREATGSSLVPRLGWRTYVKTNRQAQAPDEEEGQPRQEAELRSRLTQQRRRARRPGRQPGRQPLSAPPRPLLAPTARRARWSARPR